MKIHVGCGEKYLPGFKHIDARNFEHVDYVTDDLSNLSMFDDNTIYLLHNKSKFDAGGSRDLANQILSSAEYLSMHRFSSDSTMFFEEYYDKIAETAKKKDRLISIGKAEFVDWIKSAKSV